MGIIKGFLGIALLPVTTVEKTIKRIEHGKIGVDDVCSFGITTVAKGMKDAAKEIDNDFKE